MSERISFRGRGRGLVVEDVDAVSKVEPRVKFIKGWLTGGTDPADGSVECGEGTAYPMLVTPAQLFEIYCRVKDAEFTAGELTLTDVIPPDYASLLVSSAPRPTKLAQFDAAPNPDLKLSIRGYCAVTDDAAPSTPLPNVPLNRFGAAYYATQFWGDFAVRDIGGKESAMWDTWNPAYQASIGEYFEFEDLWATGIVNPIKAFRTGFTQFFADQSTDALTTAYGLFEDFNGASTPTETGVHFGNNVAFIDNAGDGNPFNPSNEMWANFEFLHFGSFDACTNKLGGTLTGTVIGTGIRFVVVLSDGSEVSCPIYYGDGRLPVVGPTVTGTDFRLEAVEWWPYKTKAGLPAWDSTTGLPINGGPSA